MDLNITGQNVYVISDIHNDAEGFIKMLKKIRFSKEDILIINGDIFDRGYEPVELYFEILKHDNIYVIQGNHDVWVRREIKERYAGENTGGYISYNTIDIMRKRLTQVDLLQLADWLKEQPYYINLTLDGQKFQIAHAQTYPTPDRINDMSKFYMGDWHWEEFLSGETGLNDIVSVVGHVPTDDGAIWISPNGKTIRIDCGNGFSNNGFGRLGALRLNDMENYYVW